MYNQVVSKRFLNLQNAGIVTSADAVGQAGSIGSGDLIKIYLRIFNGEIVEAKFKTYGSVYTLVASDLLCDLLKNCAIENALLIKGSDIVKAMNGLPENKMHIPDLIESVVSDAVDDYYKKLARAKANAKK